MTISKTNVITSAFYTFGLVHHLYLFYYLQTQIDFSSSPPDVLFVQRYNHIFLTSWNMCLQTFYFLVALSFELLTINKNAVSAETMEKFAKFRGHLFATLVLPSTAVVAFFFWLFYHMNRQFVFTDGIEEVVPAWVNHCIHTNIIFLPIIELIFQKMYVPSAWQALLGLSTYSAIYHIIYFFTYSQTGKFLYPIHNFMTWPQRMGLIIIMTVTGVIASQIYIFIQNMKSKTSDIAKENYKRKVANVSKKLL